MVRIFPVALRRHVVHVGKQVRQLLVQKLLDLRRRPDVELALLALAVGVQRAVERPFRRGHLALHPAQRLLGDLAEEVVARRLPCLQVDHRQQGIVVQHFLEVGRQPALVGAVAMKAAAEVVVHAAAGHAIQRQANHVQGVVVAEALPAAQQQAQVHRVRKLGRAAEAAVRRVEGPAEVMGGLTCRNRSSATSPGAVSRCDVQRRMCSVISAAARSMSARRSFQASVSMSRMRRKPGRP